MAGSLRKECRSGFSQVPVWTSSRSANSDCRFRFMPQTSVQVLAQIMEICGKERDPKKATAMHSVLCISGLDAHPSLGFLLVWMLVAAGCMQDAELAFGEQVCKTACIWNCLITGYVKRGSPQRALAMYQKMQEESSVHPTKHTYIAVIMACTKLKNLGRGIQMHAEVARMGLLDKDLALANSLIDMYAKCGLLTKAKQVFEGLQIKNVVSWTALIGGYAQHGRGEEAMKCFEEMQRQRVPANERTFVCILKACNDTGNTGKAEEIHRKIERLGLLKTDIFIGSTLVDMYAKNGSLVRAQEIFDGLSATNAVTWNAMIAGYTEHGHAEEALKCFQKMYQSHVPPNAITFVCGLKACGIIGAVDKIGEMHDEIERRGLLEDVFVSNTLVDVYARCGALAKARQVFDKLLVQDVISWTALMAGYAQVGESNNVFTVFDKMLGKGVQPDPVTFVIVLNTCSRAGLWSKGQTYFEAMRSEHGITPMLEHHTCILDLFGRVGLLNKVIAMMKEVPHSPNVVTLHSILFACKKWGSVGFAKMAFEDVIHSFKMGKMNT